MTNNKSVYIPSIEAEEIYDMSVRGLENIMKYEYLGMIPYSLELIKLRSYKKLYHEKEIEKNGKVKLQSDAIINVKFKNKLKVGNEITSFVRGHEDLMKRLFFQYKGLINRIRNDKRLIKASENKREIEKLHKSINYYQNKADLVKGHYIRIKNDSTNEIYNTMKAPELREYLYVNGFIFKGRKYKFYKRTASKSRQSKVLFILEDLYTNMKEWSHMGLEFKGKTDVASLLAYESLVSSSIESTIKINPNNIFIIDDQFSEFPVSAIEVGNDLKAKFNENATDKNNIWDGQGLMDVSLFRSIGKENRGMALLRQHFFKSCMFNTNIQQFLFDNQPKDKPYEQWELTDSLGNKLLAKDILVITTPSSLKFLKYAEKGKQKEAFVNWKKRVRKDKNLFGICKHEKSSKYGEHSYTSYQMINTLDANKDDIKEIANYEVEYIKSLQGIEMEVGLFDEIPYMQYLDKHKDLTNANEMFTKLYEINPEVVRTKMFRDYRTKQISNYRTKVKGGRLRLEADYCTVVSNPHEMLERVLKKDAIVEPTVLKGNQIHTKLHDFNEAYTLVRNPHNSPNNFFAAVNIDSNIISTYFNFSKNIVVINSIESSILSRLNGMDMDSDTTLIVKSKEFNRVCLEKTLIKREYPLILNKITSKANPVELTNKNIAEIDTKTAKSQVWIGMVTNAAQYQMSLLWDIQNTEVDSESKDKKIKQILENLAVCVVLSNVAIDYSKKIVEVDIDKILREIRSSNASKVLIEKESKKGKVTKKLVSRKKPQFWKYVTSSDAERENYQCPMDLLINHIDYDIQKATYRKNLPLSKVLIDLSNLEKGIADAKQINDIKLLTKQFDTKVKEINSKESVDKECYENYEALKDLYNTYDDKLKKKKIKKETMYKIVSLISECYDVHNKDKKKIQNDLSGMAVHLMNGLFRTHTKTFLSLFKK